MAMGTSITIVLTLKPETAVRRQIGVVIGILRGGQNTPGVPEPGLAEVEAIKGRAEVDVERDLQRYPQRHAHVSPTALCRQVVDPLFCQVSRNPASFASRCCWAPRIDVRPRSLPARVLRPSLIMVIV